MSGTKARSVPFTAKFEYVRRGLAVVELFAPDGEWSGAQRVEKAGAGKAVLFEAGYTVACQKAAMKGGHLEAFRDVTSEVRSEKRRNG